MTNDYDEEELEILDGNGIQNILSTEYIQNVVTDFHTEVRQPVLVCAICDQFCPKSTTQAISVNDLTSDMLKPLVAPDSTMNPQLPVELLQQYDISGLTKNPTLFENVLLSPRGVIEHEHDCPGTGKDNPACYCTPHLVVCKKWGCFMALQRHSLPKFSIANGNYFGQLPQQFANLKYGTACLLRPVQSYDRIVEIRGHGNVLYGTRLTGHMYSRKLDTPLVRKKLPISLKDIQLRAVVVSPFAKMKQQLRKRS